MRCLTRFLGQLLLVTGLSASLPSPAAVHISAPVALYTAAPAPLRIDGLRAGQTIELVSTAPADASGRAAVGRARFVADRRGEVDLGRDAPSSGDYAGVDAGGLFWAARRAADGAADASPEPPPATGTVRVDVLAHGVRVATAVLRTAPSPGALVSETVPGFPGALLVRPSGARRLPVIIVLGGSEGGSQVARQFSPLLAADGFAVLGLPYYSPGYDPTDRIDGLPTAFRDIPVDRLVALRAWLRTRPDVDADRIGVWGASKGAEFALIAASRYDWIRAVVAVVPSDVVWSGWGGSEVAPTASFALGGVPLPFVPYAGMDVELAKAARGEPMDLRRVHERGRIEYADRVAAARIPIERYRGRLLLVAGEQDTVWPSADMARAIVATRAAAGQSTDAVIADSAGHGLAGPGTSPTQDLVALGGSADGIAHARRSAWAKTLGLFHAALDAAPAP